MSVFNSTDDFFDAYECLSSNRNGIIKNNLPKNVQLVTGKKPASQPSVSGVQSSVYSPTKAAGADLTIRNAGAIPKVPRSLNNVRNNHQNSLQSTPHGSINRSRSQGRPTEINRPTVGRNRQLSQNRHEGSTSTLNTGPTQRQNIPSLMDVRISPSVSDSIANKNLTRKVPRLKLDVRASQPSYAPSVYSVHNSAYLPQKAVGADVRIRNAGAIPKVPGNSNNLPHNRQGSMPRRSVNRSRSQGRPTEINMPTVGRNRQFSQNRHEGSRHTSRLNTAQRQNTPNPTDGKVSISVSDNSAYTNLKREVGLPRFKFEDQSMNAAQQDRKKTFGFKRLLELRDKDVRDIVITAVNPNSLFLDLFEEELKPDWLILIMAVLGKVCSSEDYDQSKNTLITAASNVKFLEQLSNYLIKLPTENNEERIRGIASFYDNILVFISTLTDKLPTTAFERLEKLILGLEMSMNGVQKYHNVNLYPEVLAKYETVRNSFSVLKDEKKHQNIAGKNVHGNQSIKPPDNFRNMSIIPTFKDIFTPSKTVFLRQNIVKGSYESVEHYLDVQFRLLREDFIGPLRDGIQEFLNEPNFRRRINNIKIYHDVQFLQSARNKNRCGYIICFDKEHKFKKVIWEFSKRFMFGSLLLFTSDNFKSFFFATVSERETKQLVGGITTVEITHGTDLPETLFTDSFIMVECDVFFQPYFHVLSALQTITDNTFPMEEYIVHVNAESYMPKYVTEINCIWDICNFEVDILSTSFWPSPEQLCLDNSQYKAFKAALTEEFVAIQGPPGTGKTHIGLMVAKVILDNIKNIRGFGPMLVICYTNHALDQFLEGLLSKTKNIIRIGGQSRSEIMQQYNLNEVRKRTTKDKTKAIVSTCRNLHYELKATIEEISTLEDMLKEILKFKGVLKQSMIEPFMTSNQKDLFAEPNYFTNWLTEEAYYRFSTVNTAFDPSNLNYPPSILEFQENSLNSAENEFQRENNANPESQENDLQKSDDLTANIDNTKEEEMITDESDGEEEQNDRLMNDVNVFDDNDEDIDMDLLKIVHDLHRVRYCLEIDSMETLLQEREYNFKTLIGNDFKNFLEIQSRYNELCEMKFYKEYVKKRLLEISDLDFVEMTNVKSNDLWQLEFTSRWKLYRLWVEKLMVTLKNKIKQCEVKYRETKLQYEEMKQIEDLIFVSKADVVGITTTGAARIRSMLNMLKAKIVIVEEAAEVLEAHIVTSITKDCQHVILIGDHEQLRPSTAVYKLAKHYNMDISLFERMLRNGLGCHKLGVQHRMRPEIASLVVPTIYPELANHPSVENRPNIKGITHNLFFITHSHEEDEVPDSASRRNMFEADFMMALCRHLMLQGYDGSEITVLSTYTGQMQYMIRKWKRMDSLFRDVRVTVVDKYQGEENRIILLSLVRSNKLGKIGFLATKNRVCVALSRAKEGLYIIGNMSNLEDGSTIWPDIKKQLEKGNHIGPELTLRCEVHENILTRVKSATDFYKVPQGGCNETCNAVLDCGHCCQSICHIIDREHIEYDCQLPCTRKICSIEGHNCPKPCFQECGPCLIYVEKDLPCGHTSKIHCYILPEEYSCKISVTAVLPTCNHEITKPCGVDVNIFKCYLKCEDRLPCGHQCILKCHKTNDPDHLQYRCMRDCELKNLKCIENHKCTKRCYEECGECTTIIEKIFPCGHKNKFMCSADMDTLICNKACKQMLPCGHKCKRACYEECGGCREQLTKELPVCKHPQKNVLCSEEPDPKKCSYPCNKMLKCGHACERICNQVCKDLECVVRVNVPITAGCGHLVTGYECYLKDYPEELSLFCKSACHRKLDCGHICEGDCGRCITFNSVTIHAPCQKPCAKKLVCGHICKGLCGEICPPCNQPCLYECQHKRCRKQCGEPCDRCNQNCTIRCLHAGCAKNCSQNCNIEPCKLKCGEVLPCGHNCNDVCGVLCPPCAICHPYEFKSKIQLEDCKCIVDIAPLDDLFKQQVDSKQIRLNTCPNEECGKLITKTGRFKQTILTTFKEITEIKRKVISQMEEITKSNKIIAQDITTILTSFSSDNNMRGQKLEYLKNFGGSLRKKLNELHFSKHQPMKHYALILVAKSFCLFMCKIITSGFDRRIRSFIQICQQRLVNISQSDINNLQTMLRTSQIPSEFFINIMLNENMWFTCALCKSVVCEWGNIDLSCNKCNPLGRIFERLDVGKVVVNKPFVHRPRRNYVRRPRR